MKNFGIYIVIMCAVVGVLLIADAIEPVLESRGIYSTEQALRGKPEFYSYCASCHNEQFFNNAIRQRIGQPVIYLFEEISTTMPMNAPGFLRDEVYEDIFAYVLESAGLPTGTDDLTYSVMKENDFRF
jgi:hypothetical protein